MYTLYTVYSNQKKIIIVGLSLCQLPRIYSSLKLTLNEQVRLLKHLALRNEGGLD